MQTLESAAATNNKKVKALVVRCDQLLAFDNLPTSSTILCVNGL